MTAQVPDHLHVGDREYRLLSNPLEGLWSDTRPRPRFISLTTAHWRGYVATWLIEDNRLYLTAVEGVVFVDEQGNPVPGERDFMEEPIGEARGPRAATRPASLDLLFPGAGERVHAGWFTGELRLPEGDAIHYVHMGYLSIYERELRIRIERGVVVASEVVETGETFRREVEALRLQRDQLRPAQADTEGWLTCPHCGIRFTVRDKGRWTGEHHRTCGGRISLEGTVTD